VTASSGCLTTIKGCSASVIARHFKVMQKQSVIPEFLVRKYLSKDKPIENVASEISRLSRIRTMWLRL